MREVISTAEAAATLGVRPKTVVAMIRAGHLEGYPQMTIGGRIHAWKVFADSIASYQRKAARSTPLEMARHRRVA